MFEDVASAYVVSVEIPFSSTRHAKVAYEVLRIDAEPKRSFITKKLKVDGTILKVEFAGDAVKNLRVGLTSFFELLMLSFETLKKFGDPAQDYSF